MAEKKKVGFFDKIIGKKSEPEFTAEMAWIESTYGKGTFKEIEKRIAAKQKYIKTCVEQKFKRVMVDDNNVHQHGYSTYHCVIDIEEDLASYVDAIFEPFTKANFNVINISEQVKEIDEPNIYLVSWKNAFKNQPIVKKEEVKLLED